MRYLTLCTLALLLGATAGPGQPPVANDLRGTWEVVEGKFSGTKVKTSYIWEFLGDKVIRKSPTGSSLTYRLRVDSTKTPAEIDFVSVSEKSTLLKKPSKGIYKVEGDTLILYYAALTSKPRPTAFNPQPGDSCYYYILKRKP